MKDDLEMARQNVKRAQDRMKNESCGCFGDSPSVKGEQAIKLFERSAIIFERESQFLDAGKCYEEMASIKSRLNEDNMEYLNNAARAYSHVDKKKSLDIMQQSVKVFENKGQYEKAADIFEQAAKHFEEEKDYNTSVNSYIKAAHYYSLTSKSYSSKEQACKLKAADISVINNLGDWKEHVEVYDSIGKQYLLNTLLKYNAKEMFFKVDHITANAMLNQYKGQDPSLSGSSEYEFLYGTIQSLKNCDKNEFESTYNNYKNTNSGNYDLWNKHIMSKIYKKVQEIDNNGKVKVVEVEKNPEDFLG